MIRRYHSRVTPLHIVGPDVRHAISTAMGVLAGGLGLMVLWYAADIAVRLRGGAL